MGELLRENLLVWGIGSLGIIIFYLIYFYVEEGFGGGVIVMV